VSRCSILAVGALLVLTGCATADKAQPEPSAPAPPTVAQLLEHLHRGYASQPRLRSRPTLIAWASDGTTPVVSAGMAIDYDNDAQHVRWTTDDMKLVIVDGHMQFMGRTVDEAWRARRWTGTVVDGIASMLGSQAHVPAELLLYDGPPSLVVLQRITGGTIGPVTAVRRAENPPSAAEVLVVTGRRGTAEITIDSASWRLRRVESRSRIAGNQAEQLPPIRTTITYENTCPDRFDPPIELMKLPDS